jgi:hypothetical protein
MQERYVLICMPSHAVWRAALRPAPFAARRAGELTRSPRPRWLAASSVWSGKRLGSLQIDFQNPTRVDAGQTVDIRVSGTLPTGGDPILQLGRRWGRVSERRPAAGLPPRISEPSKGADHRTGDSQSAPARPIGPFQRSPSRVSIGRPKCVLDPGLSRGFFLERGSARRADRPGPRVGVPRRSQPLGG